MSDIFFEQLAVPKPDIVRLLRCWTVYNLDSIHNIAAFPVVLPLHPRTKRNRRQSVYQNRRNYSTIDPVSYLDMVMLEKHCQMILTDSGGVQKEAFFFQKPLPHHSE